MHGVNLADDGANLADDDADSTDDRVAQTPRQDVGRPKLSWQEFENIKAEGRMLLEIARESSFGVDRSAGSVASVGQTRQIVMELKWLQDRRALADRVTRLMQSGDPVKAVALVRKAQKDGRQCDMAWNRIIQYCSDRGHVLAAFRFYNDVSLDLVFLPPGHTAAMGDPAVTDVRC